MLKVLLLVVLLNLFYIHQEYNRYVLYIVLTKCTLLRPKNKIKFRRIESAYLAIDIKIEKAFKTSY